MFTIEKTVSVISDELKKKLDTPVERIDLPGYGVRVRILRAFSASFTKHFVPEGVVYVGDIILLGEEHFMRLAGVSRKSLEAVKHALELLGLSFSTDITGWIRPKDGSTPLFRPSATLHPVQSFLLGMGVLD